MQGPLLVDFNLILILTSFNFNYCPAPLPLNLYPGLHKKDAGKNYFIDLQLIR